jgi:hypothetical protein
VNFLGTYANLAGLKIGQFTVEELAGRDASGAPRWRIVCADCHYPQTLPHSRIAPLVQGRNTQTTLRCANPACPQSHRESQSETIDEFRKRQRREAEQAARVAAEVQRAAEAETVKQRIEDARIAALKAEYRFYWNHQINTTIEESRIAPLARWCQLSDGTRKTVLDRLRANPTARIQGL